MFEPTLTQLQARKAELDSTLLLPGMHIFSRVAAKDEYQKSGVCAISKATSKLTNWYSGFTSHFCGKLVQEKFITRKRRDPKDPSKFHPLCDICNQAYLDRKEVVPYLSNVQKLQKAVNTRKSDCDALTFVADELENKISMNESQTAASEEGSKLSKLESMKTHLSGDLNRVTRDVQTLIAKERELNEDVLRMDRVFEDKWKLLNEM